MPSKIGFSTLTSGAFVNEKPNKQTIHEKQKEGLEVELKFQRRSCKLSLGKASGLAFAHLTLSGAFVIFALPGRQAFAIPEAIPKRLTCTWFPIRILTTPRILLEKRAYWLICQEQEKIEEGCKGMFSIICMYSSLIIKPEIHREIGSYRLACIAASPRTGLNHLYGPGAVGIDLCIMSLKKVSVILILLLWKAHIFTTKRFVNMY